LVKKLITRTRDKKVKREYTLRGFLEEFIITKEKKLLKKFIKKYHDIIWYTYGIKVSRCTIARDLTVQRKGVWPTWMQMDYFADCAMGNTDNNALHYMDLESSIINAEKMGAYEFGKHLKSFTDNLLCTISHIDGGNRTDSIVLTLTNQIPVAKGNYDYGCDEEGNHIHFILSEDTFFDDLPEDFQNAILDYSSIEVWVYYDLTRSKRKALFRKLNDGIDLSAAEYRNCEESDACAVNRTHDLTYDKLYITTKVLTEGGVSRWKLSEYAASMKSARRTLTHDEKGKLLVSWPSSKTLDVEYQVGTDADRNAENEETFYQNNFISYLKVLEENDYALFEKQLYIDFFLLMSYLKKNSIDLTYPVTKEKKLAFLKLFNDKHTLKWNTETKKPWISKITKNKPVKVEWSGLYSKNDDRVLTQRLNRWVDEFVPEMLDKGVLVKITKRTSSDKKEVSILLKKQKSITKISGAVVNTLKIAADPKYINVDHVKDLRGGGLDTIDNKSVELGDDNYEKGAERI